MQEHTKIEVAASHDEIERLQQLLMVKDREANRVRLHQIRFFDFFMYAYTGKNFSQEYY